MSKYLPKWAEPRFTVQVVDIENKKVQHAQKICRDVFMAAAQSDQQPEGNAPAEDSTPFVERTLAKVMKEEFEKNYGGLWHCTVGTSFGAFVTHRHSCFLYFFVNHLAVLIYKSA
ncbi:dynein light chain type 1 domain-containing protein [Ditylenchus destructor]|uniref:Dynein light chain n=1 Tax=Ditylenchus destructor TaxID=166010 RepID=A0AAD4MXA3_9BILA|nr:dynein light chain type 1 domain-containing protein [Ditylenchus destructor]